MTSPQTNKTAAPYRPRRAALNWVDFLVIGVTAAIFLAVVATNTTHAARAQGLSALIPASELPSQDAQIADQPGLIKARIGLAMARPWT